MIDLTLEITWNDGADILLITPGCNAVGVWWSELELPEHGFRTVYAPPSNYVPGNVILSSVADSGDIVGKLVVRGSDLADLQVQRQRLIDALAAWPKTVRLTADEGAGPVTLEGPWKGFPSTPRWSPLIPRLYDRFVSEAVFSIPVNPVGAP